jgi:hypothetical protein
LAEIAGMTHDARIDLRIPRDWRIKLDEIADEVGLSASDIARLGIRFTLKNRDLVLKLRPGK